MVYAFLKTEHKEQLITLCIRDDDKKRIEDITVAVSYTHLTLPTICSV